MADRVVGIDLGGTKVFGALVEDPGGDRATVLDRCKQPTPTESVDAVVGAVVEVVRSLHDRPAAVGIGTPGAVAPGTGVVLVAPNLPGFDRPVPLADLVAGRLGVPVVVGNDVNMSALGEVTAGAAVGHDDVLAVWLGTGLGAGLVLDGRLRVGPHGLAGELGHTVVVPGGRRCACGGHGHLEAYIGRRSLEQRARELHAAGRATQLVELAGEGRMKSKVFETALAAGDEVAAELIDEGLAVLGIAIANVMVTVDVGAVVVGGGLGERLGPAAVDRIERSLRELRFAGDPPEVVLATLGDLAGALGAAALAADAVGAGARNSG